MSNLPCPFCGGKAEQFAADLITCSHGCFKNYLITATTWNRRAAPSVRLPQRWRQTDEEDPQYVMEEHPEGSWMRTDDVLAMLREAGIGVEGGI